MKTNPVFVVGDVHGCLDELKELVGILRRRSPSARIVLLGDLLDKGPDGPGCVQFAREERLELIQANHEERYLRWRKHEDRKRRDPAHVNPMTRWTEEDLKTAESLTRDDFDYLAAAPVMVRYKNWVAVHGGLQPFVALEDQQANRVIRLRWVDAEGNHVPVNYDDRYSPPEEGVSYWMEKHDLSVNVVYGHEAHSLSHPRMDRNRHGALCLGIDTGVVHGGHLTAVDLDDPLVPIQVKARKVYQPTGNTWGGQP